MDNLDNIKVAMKANTHFQTKLWSFRVGRQVRRPFLSLFLTQFEAVQKVKDVHLAWARTVSVPGMAVHHDHRDLTRPFANDADIRLAVSNDGSYILRAALHATCLFHFTRNIRSFLKMILCR